MSDDIKPQRSVVAEHGKFEMVPHWVLFNTDLSHVAIRLYLVLRQHANAEDECFPGRKRLSTLLGVSVPTVDRARADLVDAGAICERPRYTDDHGSSSNMYHVHWHPGACGKPSGGVNNPDRGGFADEEGGVTNHAQGGVTKPAYELIPSSNLDPLTQTLVRDERVTKPVGDDPSFILFWQTYPRKTAKGHARRAWQKAVRQTPAADIIAGAVRYRDDPNREPEYTALPATWLNGERWLDEPLPSRSSRADQKVSDVQAMITRAAQRDGQLGIGQ